MRTNYYSSMSPIVEAQSDLGHPLEAFRAAVKVHLFRAKLNVRSATRMLLMARDHHSIRDHVQYPCYPALTISPTNAPSSSSMTGCLSCGFSIVACLSGSQMPVLSGYSARSSPRSAPSRRCLSGSMQRCVKLVTSPCPTNRRCQPDSRAAPAQKRELEASDLGKPDPERIGRTRPPSCARRTAMRARLSSSPRPSRATTALCRRSILRFRCSAIRSIFRSIPALA